MPTLAHITDLHLDSCPDNLASAISHLNGAAIDLFLIGGDNGGDEGLASTVQAIREHWPLAAIGWVKGNHDLWHRSIETLWQSEPRLQATYLELGNLELEDCIVVGTYGHYDYSGTRDLTFEQYESFTDGRYIWNDRFIQRNGKTNPDIAVEIAERFNLRYAEATATGKPIVLLMHTSPFPPTDDSSRCFASGYCCNQSIGNIIRSYPVLPKVLFWGHTHQPSQHDDHGFPIINTGSDYRQVRVTTYKLT